MNDSTITRGKVLVVDDSGSIRMICRTNLELFGYEVMEAEDGVRAVELLKKETIKPDVVLLDQMMPRKDGLAVFEDIKLFFPDISVIMMTAHGSVQLATEFMKRGGADFVEKPFDADVLELKLRKALRERELKTANRKECELRIAAETARHTAEELLINFGHEVRTPATVIKGMAELLERELGEELSYDAKKFLAGLSDNVTRLVSVLSSAYELGEALVCHVAMKHERCGLDNVLENLVADCGLMAGKKDVALTLEISECVEIVCDSERIGFALQSILGEAIVLSVSPGEVKVFMSVASGNVVIEARFQADINEIRFCSIFQPFSAVNNDGSGGGVNLALSRRIIELHGGSVTASKKNADAVFEINLPAGE